MPPTDPESWESWRRLVLAEIHAHGEQIKAISDDVGALKRDAHARARIAKGALVGVPAAVSAIVAALARALM